MLRSNLIVLGLLALGMGCGGQSMSDLGGKNSPEVMKTDNMFFKNITIGNMTEIESSKVALEKSQDPSLKNFAQKMIDDHSEAGSKVAALAAQKQVVLPTKLDDDHQKMIDNLSGKTGTDFNKAYIDLQQAAHKEAISVANNEVDNGSDPDVRALASKLQPKLNMHLRMAEDLQSSR